MTAIPRPRVQKGGVKGIISHFCKDAIDYAVADMRKGHILIPEFTRTLVFAWCISRQIRGELKQHASERCVFWRHLHHSAIYPQHPGEEKKKTSSIIGNFTHLMPCDAFREEDSCHVANISQWWSIPIPISINIIITGVRLSWNVNVKLPLPCISIMRKSVLLDPRFFFELQR